MMILACSCDSHTSQPHAGFEHGDGMNVAPIIAYSDTPNRGRTVGAYYLIRDTVVTSGSFAGAALWNLDPGVNFRAAAGLGAEAP